MKTCLLILLFLLVGWTPRANAEDFFVAANSFLSAHVEGGAVDYARIKKSPAKLRSLVKQIATYDLTGADVSTQKAFWIDAYNLLVIASIVEHHPVARPTDVPGFIEKKLDVAGARLTLTDIVNDKIRKVFKDPRVHFALSCGALGCAPLASVALTPSDVETQLDVLTRDAMNNPKFVKVVALTRIIVLPTLFKWYERDFLAAAPSVLEYVNRYRDATAPATFEVHVASMNWTLNGKL